MSDRDIEPIRVHIASTDVPTGDGRRQVAAVFAKFTATAVPQNVTTHTPNRTRTLITVAGTAGDTAYLCLSSSDAQNLAGLVITPGMALQMTNTEEMWLVAGVGASIIIGVCKEYAA